MGKLTLLTILLGMVLGVQASADCGAPYRVSCSGNTTGASSDGTIIFEGWRIIYDSCGTRVSAAQFKLQGTQQEVDNQLNGPYCHSVF